MTTTEKELIHEVEQLILHAEEDTLSYSVLEHARKLIFKINHPEEYSKYNNANTDVLDRTIDAIIQQMESYPMFPEDKQRWIIYFNSLKSQNE